MVVIFVQFDVLLFEGLHGGGQPLIVGQVGGDCGAGGGYLAADVADLAAELGEPSPVVGEVAVEGDVEGEVETAFCVLDVGGQTREKDET